MGGGRQASDSIPEDIGRPSGAFLREAAPEIIAFATTCASAQLPYQASSGAAERYESTFFRLPGLKAKVFSDFGPVMFIGSRANIVTAISVTP